MPLAFRIARISTSIMSGRQAKLLSDQHLTNLLRFAQASRYPARNRLIVLLSFKAGLRAAEIANLTWAMVVDATGADCAGNRITRSSGQEPRWPTHSSSSRSVYRIEPVARPQPIHGLRDYVRARRRDATTKHCELVCLCVPHNRFGRLLVPFGPPHLHHPRRPASP